MGIIILFFFIIHSILLCWLLISMCNAYEYNLSNMFTSPAFWIGWVLAIAFYVWYFYGVIKKREDGAFNFFFTATIQFGIYPDLVGSIISFLPKSWIPIHSVEHTLTSAIFFIWFMMLFYICVVSHFFSLYKYFNIRIIH